MADNETQISNIKLESEGDYDNVIDGLDTDKRIQHIFISVTIEAEKEAFLNTFGPDPADADTTPKPTQIISPKLLPNWLRNLVTTLKKHHSSRNLHTCAVSKLEGGAEAVLGRQVRRKHSKNNCSQVGLCPLYHGCKVG